MLRRLSRPGAQLAAENAEPGLQADGAPPKPAGRRSTGWWLPALAALSLMVLGLVVVWPAKDRYTDDVAELSRRLVGDENTARFESWYFAGKDRLDRLRYRLLSGQPDPFARHVTVEYVLREPGRVIVLDLGASRGVALPAIPEVIPAPAAAGPARPPPMKLPAIHALREIREPGEEEWTTAGLPRTSPDDVLMAKTFVRPDRERPYASVGILLVDLRRVRLHLVGGTKDPGRERGISGPGVIPAEDLPRLLAAWNGGFQGEHGSFGMVADGRQYKPLRKGFASVAVFADGSVKMGEWGRTLSWSDDMVAVRQNAALLVEDCAVSDRIGEGNETWGYVKVDSSEFITWRSAIGLTADGNLLVAAGNSLSAATLATALWAAGACTAMQLDINNPYVLASLFFLQADGSLRAERFMAAMPDSPSRFLREQERDFMYLTLAE